MDKGCTTPKLKQDDLMTFALNNEDSPNIFENIGEDPTFAQLLHANSITHEGECEYPVDQNFVSASIPEDLRKHYNSRHQTKENEKKPKFLQRKICKIKNQPKQVTSRKRKREPDTWKDAKAKKARHSGVAGTDRNNAAIKQRQMGEGCKNPRHECQRNISRKDRLFVFYTYWTDVGDHYDQWVFINHLVSIKTPVDGQHDSDCNNNEKKKYIYILPKENGDRISVCRKMFLETLGEC